MSIKEGVKKGKKIYHYHREYIPPKKYVEGHKETLRKHSSKKKSAFQKNKKTKKEFIPFKLQLLILFILMAIAITFLYQKYQEELNLQINLTDIKIKGIISIIEKRPKNISFAEYLDNIEDYDKKEVTLTGLLDRELIRSGTVGVYIESVMDDFGNKINLFKLDKEQRKLFPRIGKTNKLYNVTGKFKRKYQGLDLEVVDIVKS